MFKRIQKKGTNRVREEDHQEEINQKTYTEDSDQTGKEDKENQQELSHKILQEKLSVSNEADIDEDKDYYSLSPPVKKRVESKFSKRRGLVHQGSLQSSSMSYTQSHDSNQLIIDDDAENNGAPQPKSKFAAKLKNLNLNQDSNNVDVDMIDESNLPPQSEEENDQDFFATQAQQQQIDRIKQIRSQKRKLEGKDYVPFDESTSGGVFAKDQINAVNNQKENLEAHMLQKKLLKEQMNRISQIGQRRQMVGVVDMDNEDFLMGGEEEEEDQDEMEAFIKKRVKEGTGKEYEQIVKKDVVNYQRLQGGQDHEFSQINRYENSKEYKQIQQLMEVEVDEYLQILDEDMQNLTESIVQNQDNLNELNATQSLGELEIKEADASFQVTGEQFVRAKEASDMLEDLKDMLTEKILTISDLLKRKLSISTEAKKQIDDELLSHTADVFQECGEQSLPYAVSQKFSSDLDTQIKDKTLQNQRKAFRQKHQEEVWEQIIDNGRKNFVKRLKYVQYEAQNNVFGDVDEKYQSVKDSLIEAIELIQRVHGFKANLKEMEEMVIPYLQVEMLCQDVDLMIPEDIDQSLVLKQIQEFLERHRDEYTEHERQVFLSSILSTTYQPNLLNLIANLWNPFDLEETPILSKYIKNYIDNVYIQNGSGDNTFGLTNVKDLLNAVIHRFKSSIDLMQMTARTVKSQLLLKGLHQLANSIIEWKNIIPWSNIHQLLLDEILNNNLLKSLNKVQDQQLTQTAIAEIFDERFKVFYLEMRDEVAPDNEIDQKFQKLIKQLDINF